MKPIGFGLISQKRGRLSNRKEVRQAAINIIKASCPDVGSPLASERLRGLHDITGTLHTLRAWMLAAACGSREAPHPPAARYRRDCVGDLVQNDGSGTAG